MKFLHGHRRRSIHLVVLTLAMFCLLTGLAAASSGGDDGHGEVVSKGWVKTDTYRVMNFAVLFTGLFLLLRKPLSQALKSRITGIKEQLADLEAKKAEAEKQLAAYNEKLAKLDGEAEKIVEEYIKQGNEAKAKILKAAESAAVKLEEQAKRNIAQEFKQAKGRLQAEVLETAMAKAEEIIKTKITSDDQNRLVDEYLDKVVA